ncbi:MAG: alpha/beta hydrolase [Planctomycetaceae bacterium]|nr:alpha/beta hydrolase [Planctomycetaceae bacterium]
MQTHQPEKPLLILVHGNEMSYSESKHYGKIAAGLVDKTGEHRLVIWSWAAEKVLCGIKKDALLKIRRADAQGPVLASFLQKLKPESKAVLGGFSLGANVVCGALQNLPDKTSLRIRTVLLAAAIDSGSLSVQGKYSGAVSKTEKFLIYVNPDDWVLRFYPLLKGCRGPEAVGKAGVSLYGQPAQVRQKVKSVNIQSSLGTEHAFLKSLKAFTADKNGINLMTTDD